MSQELWALTAYVIASGSDGYQVGIAWRIHRTQDPTLSHLAKKCQKTINPDDLNPSCRHEQPYPQSISFYPLRP